MGHFLLILTIFLISSLVGLLIGAILKQRAIIKRQQSQLMQQLIMLQNLQGLIESVKRNNLLKEPGSPQRGNYPN